MNYYIILSSGEYSDYEPNYFCGDFEISQKELDDMGKKIGDYILDEFEKLPQRKSKSGEVERFDSVTNIAEYPHNFYEKWENLMEDWLIEIGFRKLPDNIPEINVAYSGIPHNKINRI